MKYEENLKAFSFSYSASSLYSLIADGEYRPTNLGRNKWKWLISGSSLQYSCNKEGFNVYNEISRDTNAAGNAARHLSPDNGEKNLKAMGYILVR